MRVIASTNVPTSRTVKRAAVLHTAASHPESSRRQVLQGTLLALTSATATAFFGAQPAAALSLKDLAKPLVRKEEVTDEEVLKKLSDAQAVLKELAAVAATPAKSEERRITESRWPGYARALREAGDAAIVLTERYGIAALSEFYGGQSASSDIAKPISVTEAMLVSIGTVITISGRTVREEARYSPETANKCAAAIKAFEAEARKKIAAAAGTK